MRYHLFISSILCFVCMTICGQEKRLALVIGNNDYLASPLKNAANDALLVAQTLELLSFDVILDTNVTTKQQFLGLVQEFGNKRQNYDVGFVYYAGHGVEINQKNYLLATQETYASTYDVEDYGMPVQSIIRYLTRQSEQVNVIILDACRDNPYESQWKGAKRGGSAAGVARIPTPNGTLVAYSTETGSTALDGELANSFYTSSLCKNMQLKDISLDQVFRNVRADVLQETAGVQRPIEFSQLTGSTYFLNPTTNTELIKEAESLKNEGKPQEALMTLGQLLKLDSVSMDALLLKGELLEQLNPAYDGRDYLKCIQYHSDTPLAYLKFGEFLARKEQFDDARDTFRNCIAIDSTYAEAYDKLAYVYLHGSLDSKLALKYAKTAVFLDQASPDYKTRLAECFINSGDTIQFDLLVAEVLNSHPDHLYANYYFTVREIEKDLERGVLIKKDHHALERFASLIPQLDEQNSKQIADFLSSQADLYNSYLTSDAALATAIALYRDANSRLNTPNWRNQLAIAQILYDLNRFEESISEINIILTAIPDHIPSLLLKAGNLYLLDKENEAIELLHTITDRDPCNQEALQLLGECHWFLQDREDDNTDYHIAEMTSSYESAIECCESEHDKLDLFFSLIDYLFYEEPERAEQLFGTFNKQMSYVSRLVQVAYYYAKDSLDKSMEINNKLCTDTTTTDALYYKVRTLLDRHEFDAALENFETLIAFFAKDGCELCGYRNDLIALQIECLGKKNREDQFKSALNNFNITTSRDSALLSVTSYDIADYLLKEAKDYRAALFWADCSVRYDPFDDVGYALRSFVLQALNQHGLAYSDLTTAMTLSSDGSDPTMEAQHLFSRAVLRSDKMFDHVHAIEDMKRSKTIYGQYDDAESGLQATNWIGVFFDRLNMIDSANHYYSLTIENGRHLLKGQQTSTATSYAAQNLALNYFVKGDVKQGLYFSAKGSKLNPDSPYFLMINILAREYAQVSNQKELRLLENLLNQYSLEELSVDMESQWAEIVDGVIHLIAQGEIEPNQLPVCKLLDHAPLEKCTDILSVLNLEDQISCTLDYLPLEAKLDSLKLMDEATCINYINYIIKTDQLSASTQFISTALSTFPESWTIPYIVGLEYEWTNPELFEYYINRARWNTNSTDQHSLNTLRALMGTETHEADVHLSFAKILAKNGLIYDLKTELDLAEQRLQHIFPRERESRQQMIADLRNSNNIKR